MDNLQTQIDNLKTLQESYNELAGAADAYNTGKRELAANITAKGVPAAATETLPELAEKVGDIQQTTTVIDGGQMYSAQLTGDGTLWDLYQVLAQMKSQWMGAGHYAALIVCEYYKGYDSLQLQGADGYFTCDGDYYDTANPLHVWHDSDNGKANRWVCFLFTNNGARLDITNTAISPCSMYIGGHIGTIEYFVNGRLTELVCGIEEMDVVDNFLNKGFSQSWDRDVVLGNVKNISSLLLPQTSDGILYCDATSFISTDVYCINTNSQYVDLKGIKNITLAFDKCFIKCTGITQEIHIDETESFSNVNHGFIRSTGYGFDTLRIISARKISQINGYFFDDYGPYITKSLIDFIVGEMITNLNLCGWNPTNVLVDATKKEQLIDNIKNHILARVSDATGGTQLVFTVSTNMYNAIASENITWNDQTMTLADAFLTKNWLLSGA